MLAGMRWPWFASILAGDAPGRWPDAGTRIGPPRCLGDCHRHGGDRVHDAGVSMHRTISVLRRSAQSCSTYIYACLSRDYGCNVLEINEVMHKSFVAIKDFVECFVSV